MRQHAAHADDRIEPFVRPAPVSRAPVDDDFRGRESLVRDADRQPSRFRDHGSVRAPAIDKRIGACAGEFLVDDARDEQPACRRTSRIRDIRSREQHRRETRLHVLRATAEKPPVHDHRIERRLHAIGTDGVRVPAEHDRRTGPSTVDDPDDVGALWQHLVDVHIEALPAHPRGDGVRDRAFARAALDEGRIDRRDGDQVSEEGDDGGVRHTGDILPCRRAFAQGDRLLIARAGARVRRAP